MNPRSNRPADLVALDVRHDLSSISTTPLDGGVIAGLLATQGGIWATLAGGHYDGVWYLPSTDLSHPRIVSSGGGGAPSTVTLADGVVWLGGPYTVECADPATGTVRSRAAVTTVPGQPNYFADIGRVSGHWIAVYQSDAVTRLVTFAPPARCG